MNERIRELAEQGGITTNLDTDYFEKDINKWVDYYSEKFAELIVRECEKVAKDPQWYSESPSSGWRNPIRHVCNVMKEHFGVEE